MDLGAPLVTSKVKYPSQSQQLCGWGTEIEVHAIVILVGWKHENNITIEDLRDMLRLSYMSIAMP